MFNHTERENSNKVVFVGKLRENGHCRAPKRKRKIIDVRTVCNNGNAVCNNEKPFGDFLINTVPPKTERNKHHHKIEDIGVKHCREVELQTAFAKREKMRKSHFAEQFGIEQVKCHTARHKEQHYQQQVAGSSSVKIIFDVTVEKVFHLEKNMPTKLQNNALMCKCANAIVCQAINTSIICTLFFLILLLRSKNERRR
jgi:hypothetical protein